jgi:hypothetical protein
MGRDFDFSAGEFSGVAVSVTEGVGCRSGGGVACAKGVSEVDQLINADAWIHCKSKAYKHFANASFNRFW